MKKNIKKQAYSFLFKITSKCNDNCDFCLEYDFIKANRPELTFSEIKKNYQYLAKKYKPEYIILTGGEPTLHPEFIKILQFLKDDNAAFRFITNLIVFNDEKFRKKVYPIFSNCKTPSQKKMSKVIVSINDLPDKNSKAFKRYKGLIEVLKMKLPIIITVLIYKGNVEQLPQISKMLKRLLDKYSKEVKMHIEFRLMYIEGTPKILHKNSIPENFLSVKKAIEKSVNILNVPNIKTTLWNFPLCYIDNYKMAKNEALKERQFRKILKVFKDGQFEEGGIRDWIIYLKPHKQCKKCKLNNDCSGIDQDYIKKFNYPALKRIS